MVGGGSQRRRWSAPARGVSLAFALVCSATLARAEGLVAERAAARELFREGVALAHAGDIDAAITAFERSVELFPHAATLYNLGVAEEQRGRSAQAAELFRRALERAAADPSELPDETRRATGERLARLDGAPERAADMDVPLRTAEPSIVTPVPLTPAPFAAAAPPTAARAPARPSPAQRARSPVVLPALGVAAVGAASTAIFGLLALAEKAELDRRCPEPSRCPAGTADAARTLEAFAIAADVSLAVTVVGAGVGAYAWFSGGTPAGTSAGAAVSGSF